MGEHLPCKQGVKSSNLFISTIALSFGIKPDKLHSFFENYTVLKKRHKGKVIPGEKLRSRRKSMRRKIRGYSRKKL